MVNFELLNEQLSPFDERDINVEGLLNPDFELPKKLDYRGDLPPAWDQGVDGPCSAYASAAMKQWQEKKDYGLKRNLSKYFIYSLRKNYPGRGMYARNTMQILQKYGVPTEKSYKKRWKTKDQIPQEVMDEALNHRIIGYAKVNTIEGLKKSLYKNGPCYATFPVYNNDPSFWKPSFGSGKMIGGHAVCIVGYDKHGFIIRNSWGWDWADDGHSTYYYTDWGCHMEIWTTIDDNTSQPVVIERKRNSIRDFLKKLFGKK